MAITIINSSKELTAVEKYLMTKNPKIVSVKDIPDDTSIVVEAWAIFEDEKEDGEVSTIISILTPDKTVVSAQSATFRDSLMDIYECVNNACPFPIQKISGKSKAGRAFVDCVLDIEAYGNMMLEGK